MPKRKEVHLKKLIKGGEAEKAAENQALESKIQPIVSYWHPNLTLGVVTDDKPLQIQGMQESAVKCTVQCDVSDVRYPSLSQRRKKVLLSNRMNLKIFS